MKKTILIKKEKINKTLDNVPIQGKNLLEPFKTFAIENGLPFKILEDTNIENEAEVHVKEGDLWFCLEGEAEFVCGGELSEKKFRQKENGEDNLDELYADDINGGEKFTLSSGDWLWIPPGEPHKHSAKGTSRLIVIKVPKAS
jgi:mannose-6-phosphate isomerase-like protein (cupin superfamily)